MGLFDPDEHTLYAPTPPAAPPARVTTHVDDDEPGALRDVLVSAWSAARRRRLSSALVLASGVAASLVAAHWAPRSYRASGEVLVVASGQGDGHRPALEWERQIRAQDNLRGVAQDAHLGPDDLKRVERALRVTIEESTVTIDAEWDDPEVAKNLVQSALNRFVDRRYQTEVAASTTRVGPLSVQAEDARSFLEKLDPAHAPPALSLALPARVSVEQAEATRALPGARQRRDAAAAKLAALEAEQRARVERLEAERADQGRTKAPGHPEMVALSLQLARAHEDTPSLVAARSEKTAADAALAEVSAAAHVPVAHTVAAAPSVAVPDELALRRIAAAQEDYAKKKAALDEENLKLRVAEAAFESKYQTTRAPEVPRSPEKPMGLLVGAGGVLASLLVMLALAALRDRRAGLFFEARQVRDRLNLPVLGDLHEDAAST